MPLNPGKNQFIAPATTNPIAMDFFISPSPSARSGMASTFMPSIIPRERFGADRRDLLRVGDILIGQARANQRPCFLELRLGVNEIAGAAPVVTALRSAVDVAEPCPLRPVVRAPLPSRIRPTDMPRQITA